jgi:hypothetical protein
MNFKEDPDFLNADLIDQIKWIQAKSEDDLMPTWRRMADSRRVQYGKESATHSMHFWFMVDSLNKAK